MSTTTVTPGVADLIARTPRELFIDGCWRGAAGGARFAVHDPATGETLAEVADAEPSDGLAALDAAVAAQARWRAAPARARADVLRNAYEAVIDQREALAALMTLEMGRPLAESRGEVAYAAEFLRWFSEEAVRIGGRTAPAPEGSVRMLVTKEPVGPCLLITPWNFPLAMGTRKVGAALAAGCTAVVKPAEQTPLSMLRLARIFHEAGLPAGVLNVVTTTSPGPVMEPLIRDARSRKLSFTGSTAVGRRLAEQAAHRLLRVSLELGGNAPFLVFEDADVDAAVAGAVLAKMRNGGEACTAANRFLVAEPIAEAFAQRLADRLGSMSIGHGLDDGVELGPLVDARQRDAVQELVDDALGRGARALTGGRARDGAGHFFEPTVLVDVPADARALHEEAFGPLAPVVTFSDEADAVRLANATEYGLAAYVYTRDLDRALRVADALETGMVALNRGLLSNAAAPFGGIKASGYGREGGSEGIEEYLATKYVAIDDGGR